MDYIMHITTTVNDLIKILASLILTFTKQKETLIRRSKACRMYFFKGLTKRSTRPRRVHKKY